MSKNGSNCSRSRIASKDENTVWRFDHKSHFFTPFFFYAYANGQTVNIHDCRNRNSVRNGCAARIRSVRSFRGLGKLHQQAISRRYYLGTACQIVKSNIFRQYMAETNRQLLTTRFTNGKITT